MIHQEGSTKDPPSIHDGSIQEGSTKKVRCKLSHTDLRIVSTRLFNRTAFDPEGVPLTSNL